MKFIREQMNLTEEKMTGDIHFKRYDEDHSGRKKENSEVSGICE